jgi:hypothetical protein
MRQQQVAGGAIVRVTVALTVALLSSQVVVGQESTGSLYGKVTDSTALPMPGVSVTITSPQLIRSEILVTSQTGEYRARLLPPGSYAVKVEIAGFEVITKQDITVQAGAALAVDFVLSPSAIGESIEVRGDSPLVDVRNS